MGPHLGAGVGQGFEDVFLLCELLKNDKVTKSNIEVGIRILSYHATIATCAFQDALQAYSEVRSPHANWVLERTNQALRVYESYEPGMEEEKAKKLANQWDPIWHHDLDADINRAIEMVSKYVQVC